MSKILSVSALEILDSRGNPTVEVEVKTEKGITATAAVPSGASTGSREAIEKRDGDKSRYLGKGVLQAVETVNTSLFEVVKGMDVSSQQEIDEVMIAADGTENKSKFGANALLGVSLAVAKAAAEEKSVPLYVHLAELYGKMKPNVLPTPMMNVINGGEHANNSLDIQEFMIIPVGAENFAEAMRMGAEIFHGLKKLLSQAGHPTSVGDEGGFAPNLKSNEEALEWLVKAVESAGYKSGTDVVFALDVAASEFYKDGGYHLSAEGRTLAAEELVDYYVSLCAKYPIRSIEDGMAEDDWDGWKLLTEKLGDKIQLVGDDLFVTNKETLAEGIDRDIANSILIKVNQIGTLTETLEAMKMAEENGYSAVVSHRSGETEDSFIADLAVATGCGQIKTGSLSRSDRMAKYNRLLRIAHELGDNAIYAGSTFIAPKG